MKGSLLVAVFALFGLSFFLQPADALTTVPTKMNFQGRLADASGNTVADGLYNMQFKLYTVNSGGSSVWSETRETTNRIQVTNGLFSTQLGEVTSIPASLFASGNLYFEITLATPATATCSTASCASWESPMTPRHQLSTSAYAYNSETLDGLDSAAFARVDQGNTFNGNQAFTLHPTTGNIQMSNGTDVITNIGFNGSGNSYVEFESDTISLVMGATGASGIQGYEGGIYAFSDGVFSLDTNSFTVGNYSGATYFSGDQNGSITVKNVTDQASAFQIQNANTDVIFNVNNQTNNITLGAATSLALTGGNTASRPSSPTEGMVYFDTTTKQLLVYANGKWQADRSSSSKVVGTSASGGTSGAVASLGHDAADFVNTSTTSAQTVINSAITALGSGGGTVYLMEGTYVVDGTINIPSNVTFSGAGAGTILKIKNSTNAALVILTPGTTTGVKIQNLTLEGNKANNSSGVQYGIDTTAAGSDGLVVDSITAKNFRQDGVLVRGSDDVMITNSTFSGNTNSGFTLQNGLYSTISNNVAVANGTYGMQFDGSQNTVTGNVARGSTSGAGFYSTSANTTFTANNAYGNNTYGFWIAAQYSTVSNNSSSSNTNAGFYIAQSNVVLSGNAATANAAAGILMLTASNNQIIGNRLTTNGGSGATSSIAFQPSGGANNNSIVNNYITDTAGTGYAILVSSSNATNTYLSGNVFSGTGATAISDTGTGTIYVNQSTTAGGLDMLNKQAASATAFQIQNASGVATLTADTSNSRIQIGSSTTDATAIVFALDNFNQASDPTGVNGAMYYNTNSNKFRCYQNGAWADCLTTDTIGASTSLNNLTTTSINQSLIAGTNNSIDLGSSGTTWRSGYFGTALYTPAIRPIADSSTALQIQNAAGSTTIMTVDTSSSSVVVGSTTNGVVMTASGLSFTGTARTSRTVALNPEYTGATFTGSGTGTLISDFCSGSSRLSINTSACGANDEHNYYAWTSTTTGAQSYSIYIRHRMPSDFSSGSLANVYMQGWRAASTTDTVELALFQANGTQCGTTTNVATAGGSSAWTETAMSGTLSGCAISAGDTVTLRVTMTTNANANTVRAGAIRYDYRGAF